MEFTDRYKALGIPYPDPMTCCLGDCEGTGWVPIHADECDPYYRALWLRAHAQCDLSCGRRLWKFVRTFRKVLRWGVRTHWHVCFEKCDGWHFVKCPFCGGTGRKVQAPAASERGDL